MSVSVDPISRGIVFSTFPDLASRGKPSKRPDEPHATEPGRGDYGCRHGRRPSLGHVVEVENGIRSL